MVYMLTKRVYIDGIHVTIYSSTMDPMGWTILQPYLGWNRRLWRQKNAFRIQKICSTTKRRRDVPRRGTKRREMPSWLVVWNMFNFPIYWECHQPARTFQISVQPLVVSASWCHARRRRWASYGSDSYNWAINEHVSTKVFFPTYPQFIPVLVPTVRIDQQKMGR